MALADPTYWYITVADYRTETTVPAWVGSSGSPVLTDAEVKTLLLDVMMAIDAYIGRGWAKYDDDQEFLFPRDIDDDDGVTIPRNIRTSARMVADAMLKKRKLGTLQEEIKSETNAGYSYEKFSNGNPDPRFSYWPPEVFAYLDDYVQWGGQFAV